MCGIAGIISKSQEAIDRSVLEAAAMSIAHRGPDGQGIWLDKNVGMAHRRLAITDKSTLGHQPMHSNSGRFVACYNGEVYNYKDIGRELEGVGFTFKSACDTEVVLAAMERWGEEAIKRFNGMFALAVWDKKEDRLILGRDRYGIKPLYYYNDNRLFSFGSEQRAIKVIPGLKLDLDIEAAYEYLTFQNILSQRTMVKDIRLLAPGHLLSLSRENGYIPEMSEYWDYRFGSEYDTTDPEEYREELKRLLEDAVRSQSMGQEEVGAYLSGGIDSGLITALSSANASHQIKTFTCGFSSVRQERYPGEYDERMKASLVSEMLNTDHYELEIGPTEMEKSMSAVISQIEEPRVGQSYPNYYAAKLASEHVRVVLAGTGGDELFGGYPWRFSIGRKATNFEEFSEQYYRYWVRLVSKSELNRLLAPCWNLVKDIETKEIFESKFPEELKEKPSSQNFLNASLYFDCKTFLHGLLVVEDKLSMAHGLETRVPYMDNRVVDFALRCPEELKIRSLNTSLGLTNSAKNAERLDSRKYVGLRGKEILRQVADNYLPSEIVNGRKQGFSAPDEYWFRDKSKGFIRKRLVSKDSRLGELLDMEMVDRLIEEHMNGTANRRLLIWSLLSLEQIISCQIS